MYEDINVEDLSLDELAIIDSIDKKEDNNSIQEMARSKMDPSDFGVPEQKKFPLIDAKHVKSAIKFFNYVDPKYEEELAMNIRKKAKEFGVEIHVGKNNRFAKYCKKEEINESVELVPDDYQVITESDNGDKIRYVEKNSIISKAPKKCPKCGSKMCVYISGEPIWRCNNKKCKYVAGVVCFDQKEAKKKYLKESYNISDEIYSIYENARSLNTKSEFRDALKEASEINDSSKRSKTLYTLIVTGINEAFDDNNELIKYSKMLDSNYIHELDDSLTIKNDPNYYQLAEVVDILANKADEGEAQLESTIYMLNEIGDQKIDPMDSSTVAAALKVAASNKDELYKSKELEKVMAHTVGALCAKLKYIMGQLDLFESEYQYDGYIKSLFPKYVKMLNGDDLWNLHLAIQEHAFTKGRGKKALSDIITISRDRNNDSGTYLANLTTAIRKDLSNIMYMIDKLYKQKRFAGGNIDDQTTKEQKKFNESYKFFFGEKSEEDSNQLLSESKVLDEDPFRNDCYMTNIKFKLGSNNKKVSLAINCRYKEDAELYLPFIEKSFNNVKKSYDQVMNKICNELYDQFKQDHGSKNVSREQFERAFYKNPLQDPVIAMKDDYGCIFTFTFSIGQYLDGRILKVYIKTDTNTNAQQYAYRLEKDAFLAYGMHSNINN